MNDLLSRLAEQYQITKRIEDDLQTLNDERKKMIEELKQQLTILDSLFQEYKNPKLEFDVR